MSAPMKTSTHHSLAATRRFDGLNLGLEFHGLRAQDGGISTGLLQFLPGCCPRSGKGAEVSSGKTSRPFTNAWRIRNRVALPKKCAQIELGFDKFCAVCN